MRLYNPANHRWPEQLDEMLRLEAAGICLFCPEHLDGSGRLRILHRTDHWSVTPNQFPYEGTKLHLLLVPRLHVDDLCDLPPEAQADFFSALGWARDHYGITFYGLGARNGDVRFTAGTVYHLHVHLLVGDVDDPNHVPVRMKLSSRLDGGEDEISSTG